MSLRRAFADLSFGQVHYRHGGVRNGDAPPLLLIHGSPGSGRQLLPLAEAAARGRYVVSPDTPGHGDSAALPLEQTEIVDYVPPLLAFLDALGLDAVDVYGTHTGGSIAAELAVHAPQRVRRLVIDGLGVFPRPQQAELLERYARPFPPDLDGAYLMRAFHFLRDQYVFFPWYDRSAEARRPGGLRPPQELHAWLVEVLKAAETYHLAYRAAFAWNARDTLPKAGVPTLIMASETDPTFAGTRSVANLVPNGRFLALPAMEAPSFPSARLAAVEGFLQ